MSQNLDSTVIYSWLSYVKHVLEETDMEKYTLNEYALQKITTFRISYHSLSIEYGRYLRIQREERLCKYI